MSFTSWNRLLELFDHRLVHLESENQDSLKSFNNYVTHLEILRTFKEYLKLLI